MTESNGPRKPSRRAILGSGTAALLGLNLFPGAARSAKAADQAPAAPIQAPDSPPAGYNILFILVDQEHFFPKWPFPVPAREWLKSKGVTFTNHQAASCVCSPARSVIYTGEHIQHSGVFDNLNYLWQPDMSTSVRTIGDRMQELGYHAAYQGKWHLSYNLDKTKTAIDAPTADYRKIIESYGFADFYGVGDLIDSGLGGYTFDGMTANTVPPGCAGKVRSCGRKDNRGSSPSISSIRTMSCTSTPTSRTMLCRARNMPFRSSRRRKTNCIKRDGMICHCPRIAASLSMRLGGPRPMLSINRFRI
jgi:hypothetical protein